MRRHVFHTHSIAFSLIEVLAALLIFSLCIVALIQGVSQTLGSWQLAEEKSKALMLAQNVMEEVLYNGNLKPGEDSSTYDPPDDNYSWSTAIDETEIPNLYNVTVSIAWRSSGHDYDVTLTSLRMQRPNNPQAQSSVSSSGAPAETPSAPGAAQ